MEKYIFFAVLITAILVFCVQIITEIIKGIFTDDSKKYNIIVLVVSIILTVAAAIIASNILSFPLTWYVIFVAVVASFFIAYGAMLGYDKLIKRVFSAVKEAISVINEIGNSKNNGAGGMGKYRSPFKASSKQTTAFKKKGNWAAGYHTGVDRVCDNRALVSPANGVVQKNDYNPTGYGYYVIITTDEGMSILMAHLKEKSALKVGAKIKAGDAVGTMGSTGNSTGPHLHIEIVNAKTWAYNTKLLDPNDYIDWNDTSSTGTATTAPAESFPKAVDWKNGSTEEPVYKQSNLADKVGTIFAKSSAKCYGKKGSGYIVVYDLDGTDKHKAGFVKYAGGVKTAPTGGKTYKNGANSETVYADTAKQTKIGSLDPNEECTCLGKIDGMYLVLYKVNGTSNYKCGFVTYNGGC